jgi:hypothetical protein
MAATVDLVLHSMGIGGEQVELKSIPKRRQSPRQSIR